MTKSELINEILSEWAYRVDDGQPNPKNKKHLAELSIVLSEMGLTNIKDALFENLEEEDSKQFTNPLLNKKLKYKNEKGEDKEAPIGNLLRLPKGSPGREAAEKLLPKDGTPERDALNHDLGGEKDGKTKVSQPEQPKDGEEAPQEDPIQKAAVMYDPKSDPAMGARLDTERDNLAKLAKTDAERAEEETADVTTDENEHEDFNPIPAVDVNADMPQADPETFGGGSDIPDGIQPEELHQFNTDIKKVAQIVAKAKENNQPIPNINLCDITVPGTNLYCDDNLGIPRDEMPQFKGKPTEGSRAASMDVDDSGEVDTEPVFRKMLDEKGIKVLQTEVPADKLKATQKDLVGAKVIGMMGALEKDPNHPKITAPIYVSRDGFVIDGHHRWAAIVAYNAQHPDNQIQMKTTVLDMDIKSAIPMCNKFAEDMGVASKKADANKEAPQEPKKEEIKMKQETYSKYEHLLDEVIKEIMDEAPAKPKANSVSVKAHDQGLEGKGGTAYGPIGKDMITHHNVKGNLVPLDTPTDLGGKAIKGAKKAAEPAPMAGYRTNPKEKDVVAQKAEPTKKALNGKLSSKMEDDDVFFPKKKAYDKQTEIAGRIQKMPLSKEAKLELISIVGKILRGQDLNNKEKELAGDWITIPATSEPKIYFATEAGDFSDHSTQVTFGKLPDEIRDALYDFAETNEVFDKGHPVKKKSMVASQLSNKKGEKPRTKVKPIIKKDKAGVVQSIKIGNTEMTRLPIPTEKDLIKQFNSMKPPMQNAEYEANLAVIALERHNAMLDDLATSGAGEIEIIDFGYDTSTSEGRKGTIDTIRDMMYDKLSKDFKKYYKGEIPKEAKTVLFALKNLSNPYDNPKGNVTQTLQQNLDAIASMMNNNPDFRAGVPDMQEIFDFMVKLGEGYAGFMPSASNWKVTDIVTYKATPNFKIKPGQSPAEVISQNIQQIKSTVMFEGGASVKYEKGGASAGYDKVMMTVYNKHKGFDTKKELLKMFDVYKWSFTPGESNRVRSSEDIRKKDAELNDTLKRAMEAGIITPAEKNQILAQGAKQAASMAAKVEKKVPFDKFKQCFGKNEKEQRANYENYKTQLGLWCKMGAMAESINNNDMRYQLFSNLRTKYSKAKAGKVKPPVHEVIDGVSTLNGMGWSYDPGIAATGKDCKFISMNNANSSHIEPVTRK